MDSLRRQGVNGASCEHQPREEQLVLGPRHAARERGQRETKSDHQVVFCSWGPSLLFTRPTLRL